MKDYPTPWQRKMMWAALTACFVVVLVVVVAAVIWAGATIISFLQPILIPVAIAAILTYLLDPLVTKMSRRTLSRTKTIALLFAIAFFALGGLTAWLVPTLSVQSANFARQIPSYTERAGCSNRGVPIGGFDPPDRCHRDFHRDTGIWKAFSTRHGLWETMLGYIR
jgi:predicted PurR-regulated permease PerM